MYKVIIVTYIDQYKNYKSIIKKETTLQSIFNKNHSAHPKRQNNIIIQVLIKLFQHNFNNYNITPINKLHATIAKNIYINRKCLQIHRLLKKFQEYSSKTSRRFLHKKIKRDNKLSNKFTL